MARRQVLVHRAHHLLVGVRTCDLEHTRMALENPLRPRAETPGHDDAPVLLERFADRLERFIYRCVDEPAGVDDHDIRRLVGRRNLVALRTQLREYPFRVHERLRAAEAHEPNPGSARAGTGAGPRSVSGGGAGTAGHARGGLTGRIKRAAMLK